MSELSDAPHDHGAPPYGDEAPLSFEELMRVAAPPVPADAGEPTRWQRLLDVVALGAELSLDDLLARIVHEGAELAGARYGALSLVDREDEDPPLRLLFTHGITEGEAAQMGGLPGGRGLLDPTSDRPADPAADEVTARRRLVSAPPPIRSFLEVPIHVGDRAFGTLYLTAKRGGPAFSEGDEQLASALGAVAAMAIENARFHEEAARRERWMSAATELLRSESDNTALQIVADWARDLSGADMAWVVAGADPAHLRLQVVSGIDADADRMAAIDFSTSLARCVAFTGRPLKVASLSKHCRAVDVSAALGAPAAGPGIVVPLRSSIGLEAVVTLAWWSDVDAGHIYHDVTLPTLLAEQTALTLHVARAQRTEQRLAVLEDRDRIARDLHDLVIQRLFAIGLDLQGISWLQDTAEIARRLDRTTDDIDVTIRDIRRTIFSLGSVHGASDARAAVVEVVERAARTMKVRPTLRFRGPVRSLIDTDLLPDILAVLSEALSNAVRHAHASVCAVEVSVVDGITVQVTDDGTGMPHAVDESGLANVRLRAERRGGQLAVTSSPGHGTKLVWSIPPPEA